MESGPTTIHAKRLVHGRDIPNPQPFICRFYSNYALGLNWKDPIQMTNTFSQNNKNTFSSHVYHRKKYVIIINIYMSNFITQGAISIVNKK